MTALMHAAYGGNFEVCHLLLENGADVNSNLHCEGVKDSCYISIFYLSLYQYISYIYICPSTCFIIL